MLRRYSILIVFCTATVMVGCGSRAESVRPGSMPAGAGAGQRGGENSGDTNVNGFPVKNGQSSLPDGNGAPGATQPSTGDTNPNAAGK